MSRAYEPLPTLARAGRTAVRAWRLVRGRYVLSRSAPSHTTRLNPRTRREGPRRNAPTRRTDSWCAFFMAS